MTQRQLATRVGRSESWLSQVERGVLGVDRLSVVHALAAALSVPAAALSPSVMQTPAGMFESAQVAAGIEGAVCPPAADELGAVVAVAGLAARASGGTTQRVEDLQARLLNVRQQWHRAMLVEAARALMRLVPEVERAAFRNGSMTPVLQAVRGDTYQQAALVLAELGNAGVGWVAADRAVRAAPGSMPALAILVRMLRRAHRLGEAVTVAGRAIEIVTARAAGGQPAALAARGALRLELATAHARAGSAESAEECLDQARADAAALTGSDTFTTTTVGQGWWGGGEVEFGGDLVAVREATVAVASGDGVRALRAVDGVDRGRLSHLWRVRLLVTVAQAHGLRGDSDHAVAAAMAALEMAPAVAGDPSLRRLVADLSVSSAKTRAGVRDLTERLTIPAS